MPFGVYRDAATDDSETLVPKEWALWLGLGVTVFIGAPLAWAAVSLTLGLLPKLVWIVVALYALFVASRFWLGGFFKGSMSNNDIAHLFWPVDHDSTSKKWLPQIGSLVLGVVLGIVAVYCVISAIGTTILVLLSLVVIAALVYVVGMVVWFWKAEVWKDGISENEVRDMVTWPVTL